ncbi:MAG: cation transporter [bacterium]|nr:cation transporter [bacterium]
MRIPTIILPLLVAATMFGGYALRGAFTQPTTNLVFEASPSATMTCTVKGVKCKGTANFFTQLYNGTSGIASIKTFAAEHKVVFDFDPALISKERIKEIMEAPIPLRDGTSRQIFFCESMD